MSNSRDDAPASEFVVPGSSENAYDKLYECMFDIRVSCDDFFEKTVRQNVVTLVPHQEFL